MFTHPAYASNPRRAYGELKGFDFYAFLLPDGFTLGNEGEPLATFLKSKGIVLEGDNKLPNGTVMLIETGVPGVNNYDVLSVNAVPVKFTISSARRSAGGMSSFSLASKLENLIEALDQAPTSSGGKEKRIDAETWMYAAWKTSPANTRRASGTSDAATPDTTLDTSDAEESTAAEEPKTGYYTDSGGYAWYYNAEKDYMEAVAAPKGKFSTQPRFDASKDASKYDSMKGVLTSSALMSRASAVSLATANGGVALPAVAVGRPAPASTPPADVAARGEQKLDAKKVGVGFRGTVSAVPTWAWITLGTLTAAGGGYFVYRRFYKK